jgi:hypothetical protein
MMSTSLKIQDVYPAFSVVSSTGCLNCPPQEPGAIVDEGQPELITSGSTRWPLGHVLAHGARRDLDPEFQ